ncbi:hypothetical protein ACFSR6_13945 [Pedobacter vanadiisoli]|uniref:DUF4397 domain-containing protein n=1 Tax=Pedobacter vanadiisoli TaxID=1761975 RepID=A0ABW5MLB2_9SPHI
MKKFLIILSAIFIVGLGCKKENIGGGGLCACSVLPGPSLMLVIKNSSDVDLLSPTSTGYFEKAKIQLYSKDANNVIKQLNFDIKQPFTYTNDAKITYYQLVSYEITRLSKSIDNTFYLKLGDAKVYELNLKVGNNSIDKLLIDKIEAVKELPNATGLPLNNIYRLKI